MTRRKRLIALLIVAAAGHDDQAEHVSRLFFQLLFYRLKMLQRVASGGSEIPRLEIGKNVR